MTENPMIMIFGPRGSGKSTLCIDFLKRLSFEDLRKSLIINSVELYSKRYEDEFPHAEILDELDIEIIEEYLDKDGGCIILDDSVLPTENTFKCDIITRFFEAKNKTRIMTFQSPISMPLEFRKKIDYIFLFKDNHMGNQKKMYEQYVGLFPTFMSFRAVYEKMTYGYNCLVVNRRSEMCFITDMLFRYHVELDEKELKKIYSQPKKSENNSPIDKIRSINDQNGCSIM